MLESVLGLSAFLAGLPGIVLLAGGLVLPFVPTRLRALLLVLLPVLSYAHLLSLPVGDPEPLTLFGRLEVLSVRIDALAMVWGHIFHIAAILGAVYSLHVADRRWEPTAALTYVGSALGAVFAGDLVTLFVYWELTAVTSVFLVWAREDCADRDRDAVYRAGLRYLVIQVTSGVLLLAGTLVRIYLEGGKAEFGALAEGDIFAAPLSAQLIFLAFGIKAAFPLLHNWLQDTYPRGTHTGAVFLSAFTTKMAIYALARGFPGTDLLIPLGVTMTLFPIFYAVLENDLRKVLAYSLNNQLGFMCVGIGIGTEMALNGAAAHAFAHILYKSLLFMAMGAVLYRAGTCKATEIGGLGKAMPWTAAFCIVGSASISAVPFLSGFVSKSLTTTAAAEAHLTAVYLLLMVASAGVVEHSGIKIPLYGFFSSEHGKRVTSKDVKEAPANMLVAMGATAALCIGIGLFPGPLYSILPHEVRYQPYTAAHVVDMFALLFFAALAFVVLKKVGIYPKGERALYLDSDWLYRRAWPVAWGWLSSHGGRAWSALLDQAMAWMWAGLGILRRATGPSGRLGSVRSLGSIATWTIFVLAFYLVYIFLIH
ncbi:MAG: Na(+)/H(+) antiporter subunit D [Holophagales bacterium]|nr:Na(+)/H(+) antiporter subunit D [Holophagales bacterium]